jgi:uncharacterized damage-inducible protein DinB
MKRCVTGAICCAALCMGAGLRAQVSKADAGALIAPAESLNALLGLMEQQVVGAADAMPAEKYDFAPSAPGDFTGVRTFGSQVKHLAEANYSFFKPFGVPGAVDDKSIEALKTKGEIMKALRDSYAYAHAGVNTITPENGFVALSGLPQYKMTRVSRAAFAMAHSMDHYGQMVEYLRMNGIIPPASRK